MNNNTVGMNVGSKSSGSSREWRGFCNESFLASVLEYIHDAVVICYIDGTIVYVNPAYTRDLNVRYENIVGRKIQDIEPESVIYKTLKERKIIVNQPSRLHKLGLDIVTSSAPIYKDGIMVGAVSIFRILSDIQRLSAELERMSSLKDYLEQQLSSKNNDPRGFSNIIANDSNMKKVIITAINVAKSDVTIFLRGETGTGKDLLCKAIHHESKRKNGPFIEVNCAAIPEHLLESELFGFEEGSFTGAKKGGKLGKFELADGGTLFLNEIGDMTMSQQAKLLDLIQEKSFTRIGGTKTISADVRIIAATNQNLEKRITENAFRKDLFFRLSVFSIHIPPLRDRKGDIPLFVQLFLNKYAKRENKSISISNSAMRVLMDYDWPGNVRELQNTIEFAVITSNGDFIKPDDFMYLLSRRYSLYDHETSSFETRDQYFLKDEIFSIEKERIIMALKESNNNKSKAIKHLGISRSQFYKKIKKYGVI